MQSTGYETNKPLISIIVPVYNAEVFLTKCIDSIITQSYSNFELLLIDDCSADNSPNICISYSKQDTRINFIENHRNNGVTITRNIGIENAKGEYVLFIDNDDYIDNNYLETFINALVQHEDIDLFTQNIIFHYQDKEPFVESNQLSLGGPWGKLFNKRIIDNYHIRFIPKLKYNEDNLFLLDYLEHSNSIYNIPQAGYHYIIHNNCASKKLETNYIETGKGLSIFLKRIETYSFKSNYNRSFATNRCTFIFHRYISAIFSEPLKNISDRKKNYKEIIKSAKQSYKYYPQIYKTDKYIILLIRLHLIAIAFFTSDILFFLRMNRHKSYNQ